MNMLSFLLIIIILKCFYVNLGNGFLSFCDNEDPNNFYFSYLHYGKIFDFFVYEKDYLVFSVAEDKNLKISVFNKTLNSGEFPKKRKIRNFEENIDL